MNPACSSLVQPRLPVDLGLTLGPLRHGAGDPSWRVDERGAYWRASRTPNGPATVRYAKTAEGICVSAWGEGAEWAVAAAPDLLGGADSLEGFRPAGRLETLHKRFGGLRIGRSYAVYEALVPTVCGQRVTWVEAYASYRALTRAWGDRAPGPLELRLVPAPELLAARPLHELRAMGVEQKRGMTLRTVARRASQLEKLARMPLDRARKGLRSLPGIGPWTSAHVMMTVLGDADAVPLGDDGLPHLVTYAFTGEPRGDDARMLELLAPYAGHRGRVVRLLFASGIAAPRFGPRRSIRHRGLSSY